MTLPMVREKTGMMEPRLIPLPRRAPVSQACRITYRRLPQPPTHTAKTIEKEAVPQQSLAAAAANRPLREVLLLVAGAPP